MSQIHEELFSPCYMSEEEYENAYKNSVFYVEKDYMHEYRNHMVGMGHIASMAKSYILKNWQKVADWNGLNIKITHGPSGKVTEYFNYVPNVPNVPNVPVSKKSSKIWDDIMTRIDEDNKIKHNPIREFTTVVLDPTDGDFSITVNGNEEHWWISDEEVIIIADYIEKQLNRES